MGQGARGLTYGELFARAGELAARLVRAGAGPGRPVGLLLDRSPEMVVAVLAALEAGAPWVPLDPDHPAERLRFVAADAGLALLVTDPGSPAVEAGRVAPGVPVLRVGDGDGPRAPGPDAPPTVHPGDPAYLLYTSGSTGRPKGVVVPHRALAGFLVAARDALDVGETDTLLAVTTLAFDIAGLELLLPLLAGGRVEIAPAPVVRDGPALARLLEASGATVMQATPATWRLLLEAGWQPPRQLRVLVGGEALDAALAGRLVAGGGEVVNLYGPTEATIWSTFHRVRPGDDPVPIGRPLPNTRVLVVDGRGAPSPVGVPGELLIGGTGLALGYHGRPAETAERFVTLAVDGGDPRPYYRTGDRVRWRPDGTLEFGGRLDHQVKVRGFRIEPGEVEHALRETPGVGEAVVVAREDAPGDVRLVAYVTPAPVATAAVAADRDGAPAAATDPPPLPDPARLRDALRSRLPAYMIPGEVVVLHALPRTPNGKLDRGALPPPGRTPARAPRPVAGAHGVTEQRILDLWRELLGRDDVGTDDNFFDVGGHSLLLARVQSRLREQGTEVSMPDLFQHATVSALAAHLTGAGDAADGLDEAADRAALRRAALERRRPSARRPG